MLARERRAGFRSSRARFLLFGLALAGLVVGAATPWKWVHVALNGLSVLVLLGYLVWLLGADGSWGDYSGDHDAHGQADEGAQ